MTDTTGGVSANLPELLWHGTTDIAAAEILHHGSLFSAWFDEDSGSARIREAFLTRSRAHAAWFARWKARETPGAVPVLIGVPASSLDSAWLRPDIETARLPFGTPPPSEFKHCVWAIPGFPADFTWQEAFEIGGAIAYEAPIAVDRDMIDTAISDTPLPSLDDLLMQEETPAAIPGQEVQAEPVWLGCVSSSSTAVRHLEKADQRVWPHIAKASIGAAIRSKFMANRQDDRAEILAVEVCENSVLIEISVPEPTSSKTIHKWVHHAICDESPVFFFEPELPGQPAYEFGIRLLPGMPGEEPETTLDRVQLAARFVACRPHP